MMKGLLVFPTELACMCVYVYVVVGFMAATSSYFSFSTYFEILSHVVENEDSTKPNL